MYLKHSIDYLHGDKIMNPLPTMHQYIGTKQSLKRFKFDRFDTNSLASNKERMNDQALYGKQRMSKPKMCMIPSYQMFCQVLLQNRRRKKRKMYHNKVFSATTAQKRNGVSASTTFHNQIKRGKSVQHSVTYDGNPILGKRSGKSAAKVRIL